MAKLKFKNNKDLQLLARETLFSKEFKKAYLDETTEQKQFWLVKDEGIYIMNCDMKKGERKARHVIYADGFDPKNDPNDDLWDRTHQISGDDFVENIALENSQLIRLKNGGDLTINLNEEYLEVIA